MKVSNGSVNAVASNALPLAAGVALLVWVVYSLVRKSIKDTAEGVGGLFTGNNPITKDTVYEGAGILATVGAATNAVTGGLLEKGGEKIASWFAPSYKTADLFLVTIFPDGAKHAIDANTVDSSGFFDYKGTKYRMGYNQANQRVAVRV